MRSRQPRRGRASHAGWDGAAKFRERVNERLRRVRAPGEVIAKDATSALSGHRVGMLWQRAVDSMVGLAAFFPEINIDDAQRERLEQAHAMAFGNYEGSLTKHWIQVRLRGKGAETGFINALKGKLAEMDATELLTEHGYRDVQITPNPVQAVWDISGLTADGRQIAWQVKTGTAEYAAEVKDAMSRAPAVEFVVSSELYDRLAQSSADFADRLTELESNAELTRKTREALDALCGNLGIDIPDKLSDALPDAAALMLGIQLIIEVVQNEREWTDADRTEKNKRAVIRALALMLRFGIHRVMTVAGAAAGAAVGGAVPIGGNLVGGAFGTIAGLAAASILNRKLQPQMLKLALDIMGFDEEKFNKTQAEGQGKHAG